MIRKIKVVDFIHGKKDSDKVNTSLPFTTNYKETKSVQSANVVIAAYTNKNCKDIETLNVKNNLIENNITDIYNTLDIIDTALNNITSDIEDINIEINNLNGKIINKQDTLVSGNNIKTINNNSILGSGNIEIASSGGTWGEIVGTLSNQTDLQNALDEKANISELPVNVSELNNDSGYLTQSEVDVLLFDTMQNIYPIGSIYISTNSTNPNKLFGFGTWEQIKDTFLLAAVDTYGVGTTGGSATHNHGLGAGFAMANAQGGNLWFQEKQTSNWNANGVRYVTNASSASNQNWGWQLGGTTDNATSLPPYLSVYVWKRTA